MLKITTFLKKMIAVYIKQFEDYMIQCIQKDMQKALFIQFGGKERD
jgi:hypothetical protein